MGHYTAPACPSRLWTPAGGCEHPDSQESSTTKQGNAFNYGFDYVFFKSSSILISKL